MSACNKISIMGQVKSLVIVYTVIAYSCFTELFGVFFPQGNTDDLLEVSD